MLYFKIFEVGFVFSKHQTYLGMVHVYLRWERNLHFRTDDILLGSWECDDYLGYQIAQIPQKSILELGLIQQVEQKTSTFIFNPV